MFFYSTRERPQSASWPTEIICVLRTCWRKKSNIDWKNWWHNKWLFNIFIVIIIIIIELRRIHLAPISSTLINSTLFTFFVSFVSSILTLTSAVELFFLFETIVKHANETFVIVAQCLSNLAVEKTKAIKKSELRIVVKPPKFMHNNLNFFVHKSADFWNTVLVNVEFLYTLFYYTLYFVCVCLCVRVLCVCMPFSASFFHLSLTNSSILIMQQE